LQGAQIGKQGRRRMHATVVALWIDGRSNRAVWSHVGDSRLYRLRYGAVDLVTVDDSVVQRMLESGVLTPQQAQDHPMKNQLLAAVGMQDGVEPHTLEQCVDLEDGDAFLLCSDGWWSLVSDSDLIATLSEAKTPQAWLDAMHELIDARSAPGQDNFSAIAVWVCDPSESTRSMDDEDEHATKPGPL
jgi:serine/threonine protein phosphatase PrpC